MMAIFYALLTSIATIFGAFLPFTKTFKKIELRYLLAFASGLMVSVAFFELLPEIGRESAFAVALGFFAIYLIEKIFLIHACGEKECVSHTIGWTSLIGIGAESLIDGIAIGIGYAVSPALGIVIAVAVIVHEVPRGLVTTIIMKNSGYKKRGIFGAVAIDAFFTPLGTAIAFFVPIALFHDLIGFALGTFLYIGASDLLPEAHKSFNWKVVASVMIGAAIIPLTIAALG
ncbi:MAG: ZIP family metal transporter [Candidatus Diapherotrites archaeon]|nr:ZIP family metal transporter [Candidatus Diapherotrites archaeon]